VRSVKRILAGAVASILVTIGFVALTAAPASAAGCKVYTNPAQFGYNPAFSYHGYLYAMGYTATLTTGDASSTCNDINIQYLGGTSYTPGTACDLYGGNFAAVHIQYRYGNSLWIDDSYVYITQCFSPSLLVVGQGYGNNVMFRIMIHIGAGQYLKPWPTFKLYV
jgi:hypothetical protein